MAVSRLAVFIVDLKPFGWEFFESLFVRQILTKK